MTDSRQPTARILPTNAKGKRMILLRCERDLALSSNAVLPGNVFTYSAICHRLPDSHQFSPAEIPVIQVPVECQDL